MRNFNNMSLLLSAVLIVISSAAKAQLINMDPHVNPVKVDLSPANVQNNQPRPEYLAGELTVVADKMAFIRTSINALRTLTDADTTVVFEIAAKRQEVPAEGSDAYTPFLDKLHKILLLEAQQGPYNYPPKVDPETEALWLDVVKGGPEKLKAIGREKVSDLIRNLYHYSRLVVTSQGLLSNRNRFNTGFAPREISKYSNWMAEYQTSFMFIYTAIAAQGDKGTAALKAAGFSHCSVLGKFLG
jgi:hypothetical protein